MQVRQLAKTAGAIVFIIAAGAVVLLKQQKDEAPSSLYEPLLKCRACGEEFRRKMDVAQSAPFGCPRCGKNEAWNLWQCNECGNSFLPAMTGEPPHPDMMPQCPRCQSKSTGRL